LNTSFRARRGWQTALVLTPVLFGVVGAWACSPSTGAGDKTDNGNGVGNGGTPGTGPSGTGASSFGGSGDPGVITVVTNAGGASGLPDGGCFATASKAEQVVTTVEVPVTVTVNKPVDMFIMYDQSGSMNDNTPAGTKWSAIKAALTGFVNSPTSAGIGVGIQYFPTTPPPCTAQSATCNCINLIITTVCLPTFGGSCTASDYAVPDVPIELLPAVAPKIVASVGAHNPGGGTPTTPALQGAQQYALGWAAAHPDRKTIVVLATDGDPSGCQGNAVTDVAAVASSAFNNALSVQTFVIGVGSSLTSLNQIAAAGGTGQALIVDAANGDPTQQFLDAMNKIREAVTVTHTETHTETHSTTLPCEWTIPAAPGDQKFDKTKVNVDFASGGNAASRIGAIPSAADCAGVTNGWHYDDPATPTKVLVCPQTCDMIHAAADAQVNVVFGCATEIAIIK
jgi:hypothetical protein